MPLPRSKSAVAQIFDSYWRVLLVAMYQSCTPVLGECSYYGNDLDRKSESFTQTAIAPTANTLRIQSRQIAIFPRTCCHSSHASPGFDTMPKGQTTPPLLRYHHRLSQQPPAKSTIVSVLQWSAPPTKLAESPCARDDDYPNTIPCCHQQGPPPPRWPQRGEAAS
jgi:hypothetical protein